MSIEIAVLVVALASIAVVFVWTVSTGSPPTPTSSTVRRTVMALLPARLPGNSAQPIYELGAGWGGLSLALAARYPDRPVIGIEVSPLPWLAAKLRAVIGRQPNLEFRYGNFLKADLSDASLVVCYLSADVLARLGPKLAGELQPGALAVSSTFAIPDWQPNDEVRAHDIYRSPVYLYERDASA